MTLVVVEVATVLALSALGGGGGDSLVDLLNGDLKDLTVLGDVLGGDDRARGTVVCVRDGGRGGDRGSGNVSLGGGGLVGGSGALFLLLAKERAGSAVRVLLVITEDGGGCLAEVAAGRLGGLAGGRAGSLGGLSAAFTADTGVGSGVSGTVLKGNAHGDALLDVLHVLVDEDLRDLESTLAGLRVLLDVEKRAVLNAARVVLAGVKSLLEEVLRFPAHDEVTVVASADRVTVRESELAVLASELVGGPDGLKEQEGVVDVVSLRALTLLDKVGVGNVGLVVIRVGLTSTAARETNLETHAVNAVLVHVGLAGEFVAVERRLGGAAVVEAVEAESPLAQPLLVIGLAGPGAERLIGEGAVEGTKVLVTSDHLEALGEGLDVVHVVQVVGEEATDLRNHDGGAVGVDEVESGGPVGRLVLGDSARSASTLSSQVGVGGFHAELLTRLLVQ